jgi:hypothetical protein
MDQLPRDGARTRWRLPLVAFLLVACSDGSTGASVANRPIDRPSPTVSPGTRATPSSTVVPVATKRALARARERLLTDPPVIHGVFEMREANDPRPLRWEVWVRLPSFRVETTVEGEPVALVTEDGQRFGHREGGQVHTTRTLGEHAAILLAPLSHFAGTGVPEFPCSPERILGIERAAGRSAIHVACPHERSEKWIDHETGVVLATLVSDPDPGDETWSGYRSIEFDPKFHDSVFDIGAP